MSKAEDAAKGIEPPIPRREPIGLQSSIEQPLQTSNDVTKDFMPMAIVPILETTHLEYDVPAVFSEKAFANDFGALLDAYRAANVQIGEAIIEKNLKKQVAAHDKACLKKVEICKFIGINVRDLDP